MSGVVSKVAILIVGGGLIAVAVPGVWNEPLLGQVSREASREEDLAEVRDRVLEYRRQLAELDDFGTGVEAELERLDLELGLQQQLVSEAAAERELAEAQLHSSQARLEHLERELAATRERLTRRILELDRAAPADWLRGFVTVRSPSDFFLYMRTLRLLTRRDGLLVPAYRAEQAELEAARRVLEERREEVARSVARERRRLSELASAKRRQSLVAKALERERLRVERKAFELDEKERKLSQLLAVLASGRDPSLSARPIQEFRGALDWPLAGEIVTPFGPKYEARYGTSVPHNGIEIAPAGSGVVEAVYPGAVIFAAPFEGFGLTVVVHHPMQVFSLYAGLDRLEVAKGDVVVLDQALGQAASRLYFEMRVENRPEDPMDWLR